MTSKPSWLADFVMSVQKTTPINDSKQTNNQYPLFQPQDLAHLPQEYLSSLANVLTVQEPTNYKQAKTDTRWVAAIGKELKALEENDTWELTSLPPGQKAISSKWVYKTKYNPDGTVERLKARLVIRGFDQRQGKDYKHTFSTVAKLAIVRVLIAIATAKGWPLHQLDINNAFLHGYIDKEIYMEPLEGYTKARLGEVCKLK